MLQNMIHVRFLTVLMCFDLLLITGCSRGEDQFEPVFGDVTFIGQPIVYGSIQLVPDKSKGHSGPAVMTEIIDGKFQTASGEAGISPGPHLVRITAFKERPASIETDDTETTAVRPGPIFQNYAMEADLTGGLNRFAVPESARGFGMTSR